MWAKIIVLIVAICALTIALLLLKFCKFQPWHFEYHLIAKFGCFPWYLSRLIFYVFVGFLILPIMLFTWFAYICYEKENKCEIAVVFLFCIFVYNIINSVCNSIYTRNADAKMMCFSNILISGPFWIIHILSADWSSEEFHISTCSIFLAMDFTFMINYIYTSSELESINIYAIYHKSADYFKENAKQNKINSFAQHQLLLNSVLNQSNKNALAEIIEKSVSEPSIPDEIINQNNISKIIQNDSKISDPHTNNNDNQENKSKEEQAPNIEFLPPINLDLVKSSPISPKIEDNLSKKNGVGPFSDVCEKRIIQVSSVIQAEFQSIIKKIREESYTPFLIKRIIFFIMHIAILVTYSIIC